MSVAEINQTANRWQFYETSDQLLEIMDSVLYYGANVSDARDAVEALRLELEDLIAEAQKTPTADDLACRFGGFECEGCE